MSPLLLKYKSDLCQLEIKFQVGIFMFENKELELD